MLLQTNSYIVSNNQRAEHVRLMRQFRLCFRRLGADFEVFEEADDTGTSSSRFVQIMRFRDRAHYRHVVEAEKSDKQAQGLIDTFCRLVDLPHQQQAHLFRSSLMTDCLACNDTGDGPAPMIEAEEFSPAQS